MKIEKPYKVRKWIRIRADRIISVEKTGNDVVRDRSRVLVEKIIIEHDKIIVLGKSRLNKHTTADFTFMGSLRNEDMVIIELPIQGYTIKGVIELKRKA